MVKRSLGKIDPSYTITSPALSGSTSSGGLSQGGFASTLTTLATGVSTLSGSLDTMNSTISRMSSDGSSLRTDVDTLSGKLADVATISPEDRGVLDAILSTVDALYVQIRTTFEAVVTFAKGVVFRKYPVYEDRNVA